MSVVSPSAATTHRAPRGGVVLVGASALLESLARQLDETPRRAQNLFEALTIVGAPQANAPQTTAVVVGADEINGSAAIVRRAFAQVDPSVRLVVVTPAGLAPAALDELADECDACLVASPAGLISAEQIRQALEVEIHGDAPAPGAAPGAVTASGVGENSATANECSRASASPPAETSSSPTAAGPGSSPPVMDDASNASTPVAFEPELREAGDISAGAPPPSLDELAPLGDVDLIEAMLTNPRGVGELAMRLLRQHTGWPEAQLVRVEPEAAGEATAARDGAIVAFRDDNFGHLVAPGAPIEQLQAWANWLARWLTLDRAHRDLRIMAFQDELTGAWNRRFFNRFLHDVIHQAREARRPVTVMVYDIDDFKKYNDTYGHDAGDEILRETVRLLTSFIRKGDRVFRIGGDEFAVVFADPEAPREPGSTHPEAVERIAKRFQDQVCRMNFPKLGSEAPGTLSISAGLATFPWDGDDPESLLRHADQLALFSKQRGKNAITLGPGARQTCKPPPAAS